MSASHPPDSARQIVIMIAALVFSSTATFGFILGHGDPNWIAAGVIVGLTSAIVRRVLRGNWWY
jgi:hypothetical protein